MTEPRRCPARALATAALALAALTALALAVVTGCGRDPDPADALTGVAGRAGCAPVLSTRAAEIAQGNCTSRSSGADGPDGTPGTDVHYAIVAFATDRQQEEWLEQSEEYGGAYLVGEKWVVAGGEGTVEDLRGRLGGTVRHGADHSGHHGMG